VPLGPGRPAVLVRRLNRAPRFGRALRRAVAAGVVVVASLPPVHTSASSVRAVAAGSRPSIVFILTDDQRWDSLWTMPIVQRRLVDRGVTFDNAFVVNSLCCPSRASILTGRYSHGTGVYRNTRIGGGFAAFDDASTIATWLHDDGYRTALIGKYLNWYTGAGIRGYVPPGWDRWVAFVQNLGLYFDYTLSVDGTSLPNYGESPGDYSTDVLAHRAVEFIRHTRGPMFLEFAPFAPHGYPVPAPRDRDTLPQLAPSRPPNFDEADVSDKPTWVRRLPRLTADRIRGVDEIVKKTNQTLGAVDDAVGRILDALRETGRLHNTLIVFTFDNGFAFGEHRWTNKLSPYEESIRVPMVVRDDALTGPRRDGHLALNIDLAPTFADLAGVTPPGPVDGRSLLPLLEGPVWWRRDFLVEHAWSGAFHPDIPTYCSVRSRSFDYTLYRYHGDPPTWDEELYDLARDPFELHNLAAKPAYAQALQRMRTRLRKLCDPPPPGFTFPS